MRAIWIDAGNDPAYQKLAANGIDECSFDIREARLTPVYCDTVAANGYAVSVYAAPNWWPTLSAAQFAEKVDAELKRINWKGNPAVCLDMETHDVNFIVTALQRWRQLRPKRQTAWTLEGHQGGLFQSWAVSAIVTAQVSVVPQCYNGAMTEVWDSLAMARDLTAAGFPESRIVPFYDAAHLPGYWSGWAFTQGRLP